MSKRVAGIIDRTNREDFCFITVVKNGRVTATRTLLHVKVLQRLGKVMDNMVDGMPVIFTESFDEKRGRNQVDYVESLDGLNGVVKWFNEDKGFGMIEPDINLPHGFFTGTGRDVFVGEKDMARMVELNGTPATPATDGDRVFFRLGFQSGKGSRAVDLRMLERKKPEAQPSSSETEAVEVIAEAVSGEVSWFDQQKGYGYLIPDQPVEGLENPSMDIFIHSEQIRWSGLEPRQLVKTSRDRDFQIFVVFDIVQGPKGPRAERIRLMEDDPEYEIEGDLGEDPDELDAADPEDLVAAIEDSMR